MLLLYARVFVDTQSGVLRHVGRLLYSSGLLIQVWGFIECRVDSGSEFSHGIELVY